jgi:beta-phosphoglucomutase
MACIFDLDGVIVDTARYHFMAWRRLAGELGVVLTEQENERLKGVGRMESLNIILKMGGIAMSEEEKEKLAKRKNEWFVEYIQAMKKEEIFPGAKDLFDQLRQHGKKVALASSSKNAGTVLEKLDIKNEFEAVVDGNMITHSKPDPEIFLRAAASLGVNPKDCLVIEDAEAGVEAALRAGMKCIGIGKAEQLGKANKVVERIGQLNYDILNNL